MNVMKSLLSFASLKIKLIVGGTLLAIGLLVVVLLGVISSMTTVIADSEDTSSSPLLSGNFTFKVEVEQYREDVKRELKKYNKVEFLEIIMSIMQQESGGLSNDPMQASIYVCGSPGCLTNPSISIERGIELFISMYEWSKNDLQLAIHSYNMGRGLIDYVNKNGGIYSYKLAVKYSKEVYQLVQNSGQYQCKSPEAIKEQACFGDILYVKKVMQYMGRSGANGSFTPLDYQKLYVTSPFGYRVLDKGLEHHNGVDYRSTNGVDPIYAVQDGLVVIAGKYSGAASYGNFVTIKHSDSFYTTYAHLYAVNVLANTQVSAGQQIGVCGMTGRSFGAHLHFETKTQMWQGHYDPVPFVNEIVQSIQNSTGSESIPIE